MHQQTNHLQWNLKVHTFTHARSGGGRKIGFNTNHYMRSNIHGRGGGAGAKSAPQQMGPTPKFPHPLRNHAPQTIFVFKKWQIRPRPLRTCVNIPAVAERECQNPPVSTPCQNPPVFTPQPLRACVNVALREIHTFSLKKMHVKMLSENWQQFSLGLSVLTPAIS